MTTRMKSLSGISVKSFANWFAHSTFWGLLVSFASRTNLSASSSISLVCFLVRLGNLRGDNKLSM